MIGAPSYKRKSFSNSSQMDEKAVINNYTNRITNQKNS
jgi:hypothetical protein